MPEFKTWKSSGLRWGRQFVDRRRWCHWCRRITVVNLMWGLDQWKCRTCRKYTDGQQMSEDRKE